MTETIAFRCSASEKARLEVEARRARRPLAELLRERLPLVRSGHRKVVPEADPDLLVALSRIGANLNQVARALNASRKLGTLDRIDLLALSASLVAIERELDGLREDWRA
ncbi:plasmid mobilization protein [Chachezhania antarctica]|uniref:plasmid mobilization protein n=1 Tax=Chachezhania antarctica TaxID=2340860 RepID=UPI0013CE831A|nr:plasmid mobilization relaxosome protein MobC [Chachezhania antarctica]